MRFAVLGSGSAGNATVLQAQGQTVLVDAGLSSRQLVARLRELGIEPEELDALLLTHEHGDHTRGLEVFLRKYQVPIYTTALTQECLRGKLSTSVQWRIFPTGGSFEIGALNVHSFAIPHDAVDPVGYRFDCATTGAIGVLTDLGFVTETIKEQLRGVKALVLEANYCERMLEADPNRPFSLKQRISSRHGHLSNHQARDFADELKGFGLEELVLAHLSRDCNQEQVALDCFADLQLRRVLVAAQNQTSPWIKLEHVQKRRESGQLEFCGSDFWKEVA